MKFLSIFALSMLLAPVSQAQSMPIFEKARVNIRIYKSTIEKVNDDYQARRDLVCEKSLEMDVVDFRGSISGPKISVPLRIDCEYTHEQKKLNLNAFAFNVVDHLDPYGLGKADDYKLYNAGVSFWFEDGSENTLSRTEGRFVSTKDLNLHNLIIDAVPEQWIVCSTPGEPLPAKRTFSPQGGIFTPKMSSSSSTDTCMVRNPVVFGALVEFEKIR